MRRSLSLLIAFSAVAYPMLCNGQDNMYSGIRHAPLFDALGLTYEKRELRADWVSFNVAEKSPGIGLSSIQLAAYPSREQATKNFERISTVSVSFHEPATDNGSRVRVFYASPSRAAGKAVILRENILINLQWGSLQRPDSPDPTEEEIYETISSLLELMNSNREIFPVFLSGQGPMIACQSTSPDLSVRRMRDGRIRLENAIEIQQNGRPAGSGSIVRYVEWGSGRAGRTVLLKDDGPIRISVPDTESSIDFAVTVVNEENFINYTKFTITPP